MKQQGLVSEDEKLVESEAGWWRDRRDERGQPIDAVSDFVDLCFDESHPRDV
jgi:hypothetical protein